MTEMTYRPTVTVTALALLLATPRAWAQRTSAQSDEAAHYQLGLSAFRGHHYTDAEREFQAAYAISHNPALLFNLGVVYEETSRWADALAAYQQYLQALPAAPNRGDVERRVRLLTATVNGAAASPTPTGTTTAANATGATGATAANNTASADAHPAAPAQPPPEQPSPAPLVIAGGGVALLIAGGIVGGLALASHSTLVDQCGGNVGACPDTNETRATATTMATESSVADLLLGLGVAATAGGALWYVLARPSAHEQSAAGVSVYVAPGSVGVWGRF